MLINNSVGHTANLRASLNSIYLGTANKKRNMAICLLCLPTTDSLPTPLNFVLQHTQRTENTKLNQLSI